MNLKKRSLITFFFCICIVSMIQAQTIYPGDVNNNGIVNGVDVLYWGNSIGKTGTTRDLATTNFLPQAFSPWSSIFPNGANHGLADADGNGLVDENDLILGIESNWWKTQPSGTTPDVFSAIGNPAVDPLFYSIANPAEAVGGQEVNLTYYFGTENVPVNNFKGLSFTVHYNTDYIAGYSTEFDLANGMLSGNNSRVSTFNDQEAGKMQISIAKTDNTLSNGSGEIGTVSFILIKDVVDLVPIDSIVHVDSLIWVGSNLLPLPLVLNNQDDDPNTTFSEVTSTNDVASAAIEVAITPNPSNGNVMVSSDATIIDLELYNLMGQKVPFKSVNAAPAERQIYIEGDTGVYILKIKTDEGYTTRKVAIQR